MMNECPECESKNCYRPKNEVAAVGAGGPDLLPKLSSGMFKLPKMTPIVCGDCGLIRFYAADEALELMRDSKHWERLEPTTDD